MRSSRTIRLRPSRNRSAQRKDGEILKLLGEWIVAHWHMLSGLYGLAGLIATAVMFRCFPPMPGYRPPVWIRLVAVLVFTLCWPIVGLIYLWNVRFGQQGPSENVPALDGNEEVVEPPGDREHRGDVSPYTKRAPFGGGESPSPDEPRGGRSTKPK